MSRRLPLVFFLALLMLAALPMLAQGRHTTEDRFHDTVELRDTEMRVWLHCRNVDDDSACDEDRTLTGKKPTSSGPAAGSGREDPFPNDELTYKFSEKTRGTDWRFPHTFEPSNVTATLRFQWIGNWSVLVRLKAFGEDCTGLNGDTVAQIHLPRDDVTGANEATRTVFFDDPNPPSFPEGCNVRLVLSSTYIGEDTGGPGPAPDPPGPEDTATVSLVVENVNAPSRLRLRGDLVATQGWTHNELQEPVSTFPLDAAPADRHVRATFVASSIFGQHGLNVSSGVMSAEFEGSPIDLRPNASASTIAFNRSGFSTPEHQIFRLNTTWAYSANRTRGIYNLDFSLESHTGDGFVEPVDVSLGPGIDVSIVGRSSRTVHFGANATYTAQVTNNASQDLEIRLTTSAPTGDWTVFAASPRLVVPKGQSRRVEVTAVPPDSAAAGEPHSVTVTANAPNRPSLRSSSAQITTVPTDVVEYDPRVVATKDLPSKIAPGGRQTFDLEVVNNGTVRDTILITRGTTPDGWSASFSKTRVTLDPGQRAKFTATVEADADERNGTERRVTVVAQSEGDAQVVGRFRLDLTVGVRAAFDVAFLERIKEVAPGQGAVIWRVTVTSRANVETAFDASIDAPGMSAATLRDVVVWNRGPDDAHDEPPLTLDPGQTGEFEVKVGNTSVDVDEPSFCSDFQPTDPNGPPVLTITPEVKPGVERSFPLIATCDGEPRRRILIEARTDSEPSLPKEDKDVGEGPIEIRDRIVAEAGDTVTFPVRVSNLGTSSSLSAEFALAVSRSPRHWEATIEGWRSDETINTWVDISSWDEIPPNTKFSCGGMFCQSGELEVEIPENASAGRHQIVVAATSRTGEPVSDTFTYVVEIASKRQVALLAADKSLEVSPGGEAVFNLVATNVGNVPETVNLSVDTLGLPGDWRVQAPPDNLELPATSSRYITVVLAPPANEGSNSTGTVNVTLSTEFGTRDRISLEASVVGPADVGLEQVTRSGAVKPGENITYDVEVTNPNSTTKTVALSTSAVPEGFQAEIRQGGGPVSEVTLQGGATQTVSVRLSAPAEAAGIFGTVLYATPGGDGPSTSLGLNATIADTHGVSLDVEPAHEVTPTGQAAEYVLTVTNRGTGEDTIFLCILPECRASISSGPWLSSLGRSVVSLEPRGSETVTLSVVPSGDAAPGVSHQTIVAARSREAPKKAASLQVNTTTLVRDVAFTGNATTGAAPGETIKLSQVVVNEGNSRDVFAVEVVGTPPGWTARPPDDIQVRAGGQETARIGVDVPLNATQGLYAVGVRVHSQFDPGVSERVTLVVRIPEFRQRDVDRDGFNETVLDRNLDSSDGLEAFTEIHTDRGIRSRVIAAARFGETVRTGFILRTQTQPVTQYRFWSPDTDALTNVTTARILRPDSVTYLVDVDGDGRFEFGYDERSGEVLDVLSVEGRRAVVVDAEGDGTMDVYHSIDRGISTQTASHPGDAVAADSDGDGSYDLLVDTSSGETRPYYVTDAMARAAADQTGPILLGLAVLVLSAVAWMVRVKGAEA